MASAWRLSDEDRDVAAQRLRDAFIRGVLTQEEFDARLDAALGATTTVDLVPVLDDLPVLAPDRREEVRLALTGGHLERLGEWDVPRRVVIEAAKALVILDFRSSELVDGHCAIRVNAHKSRLSLMVPESMPIDLENLGNHRSKIRDRRSAAAVAHALGKPQLTVTGDLYGSSLRIVSPGR